MGAFGDWFFGRAEVPVPDAPAAAPDAFPQALALVLENEGGFSDDPLDHGGATNRGVTQRTYDLYRQRRGLVTQSVRDMSDDETSDIYRTLYWEPLSMAQFPAKLGMCLFDAAINHRAGVWCKLLQRALGQPDDGQLGPDTQRATQRALDTTGERDLILAVLNKRDDFYARIITLDPSQARFADGWRNRVEHLREVLT